MIQEILNSLIKDDIEETNRLVNDFFIYFTKNTSYSGIESLLPVLLFTSSTATLSSLKCYKSLLEGLEKEESEIELKLSKTCFLFRKYYSRKLEKISSEKFEIKKNISLNKWDLISLVYYAQEIIDNKEETKNE
jgi:hypothetical protein